MSINKYIILALLGFQSFQIIKAQGSVGINTNNPLTTLHIDGLNNSSTATDDLIKDDVFITNEGKLGAGVKSPITKIDIRNNQNLDNAVGIGNTSQLASEAGPGAIRYNSTNGIQYSNGTEWITVTTSTVTKTIIAATKDSWDTSAANVYCYDGGYNSNQGTIPNRAPCYIRIWNLKHNNSTDGGQFNATTGQFEANRSSIFTATFTFALAPATVASLPENANQVEAIWRHLRNGSEINSVKCANNYSSNSSGNLRIGSSCTANFDMQKGDIIRPELWIDVSAGIGSNQSASNRRSFDTSNNGSYNTLTIVEN